MRLNLVDVVFEIGRNFSLLPLHLLQPLKQAQGLRLEGYCRGLWCISFGTRLGQWWASVLMKIRTGSWWGVWQALMLLGNVFCQTTCSWVPLSTYVTLELVGVAVHVLLQVRFARKLGWTVGAGEGTCNPRHPHSLLISVYVFNSESYMVCSSLTTISEMDRRLPKSLWECCWVKSGAVSRQVVRGAAVLMTN